jgi:hypothetical protein
VNPVTPGPHGVETRTEDAEYGQIGLALQSRDDLTPPSKLGFRLRLAAGALPNSLRLPGGPVLGWEDKHSPYPDGRCLYLHWVDWVEGQPEHCCPIHFGLVITCLDLAGNESAPSDTIWIDAPAR